jgi:regulation of enolase protein 1 (concanavalin A-like superfamily)
MFNKIVFLSFFIMLFAVNAQAELVAYYPLNGDSRDMSGTGPAADGTLVNNPAFEAGKFGQSIKLVNTNNQYVNCGQPDKLQITAKITMMCWCKVNSWAGGTWAFMLGRGDDSWRLGRATNANGAQAAVNSAAGTTAAAANGATNINDGQWHHVAGVFDGTQVILYIDGKQDATASYAGPISASTQPFCIGANTTYPAALRCWDGWIDEVIIFNEALKLETITEIMNNGLAQGAASSPSPADEETDVYCGTYLSWKSGKDADKHNVFFGTDFNDVNNATVDNHPNVAVAQGLAKDTTSFDPGILELGTTYYWRVDEVNAPPDSGINKGNVWSFKTEEVAMKIPASDIVATAKNSSPNNNPNNVINELGLDPNTDQHSTSTGNWQSGTANGTDNPLWIRFDFKKTYKLHQMFVWNMNNKPVSKYGFQKVRVEYLKDNDEWAVLTTETTFEKATGASDYVHNTTIDFNDVVAKAVRLTMLTNWDNKADKGYLSEIRFTYIPTYARLPQPDPSVNNISVDSILSWRKGREALSHSVYIDTNENDVANGTAAANSASTNSYTPSLNLGRVYYWRVDEINNTMTPSKWSGDVWSFSTEEYITMEDFEDYNDFVGSLIFGTWIGGDSDSTLGGSQVGHTDAPFAEGTIFQSGKQSGPIYYNNTAVGTNTSIGERSFDDPLNLASNGADTLRLFYRGKAVTFQAAKDGSIAMSAEGSDIQGTADQFRFAYKTLTSSTGSITVRVDSIENANAWSKAGIMIRNSLEPNDVHVTAVLAANNTAEMESRSTKGGGTTVADVTNLGNPCWLKISRSGNDFTVQRSKDGTNWLPFGTDPNVPSKVTITMGSTVYIGLVVTSHTADVLAAATFYNASTTGSVSGSTWTVAPIGDIEQAEGGNTLDALYVYLTDSTGKVSAKVYAPLLSAVGSGSWMKWEIPTSYFTNVNLTKIKKISIGVGDTATPLKGKGLIYIDNIGYGHTLVK